MRNILVTGGSGFIGSHLVSALHRLGYKPVVYDIQKLENPEIAYIAGDIMDYDRLKSAMEGMDAVCHLAALVGVVRCLNNEDEVKRINYHGTLNILRAAKETGIQNLLFTSSSEVYGEGHREKLLEEDMVLNPITTYGNTKMQGEVLSKEFAEETGAKVTVIRYCNIYGARQRREFVIPIFIDNLAHGKTLYIGGDGSQKRSFTYIDNAVDGTIKALTRSATNYEIFNIGSSATVTIKELAKTLIQIHGKGKMEFVTYKDLDRDESCEILYRIPSIKKAERLLNYNPDMPLEAGLSEVFKYHYKMMNAEELRLVENM